MQQESCMHIHNCILISHMKSHMEEHEQELHGRATKDMAHPQEIKIHMKLNHKKCFVHIHITTCSLIDVPILLFFLKATPELSFEKR